MLLRVPHKIAAAFAGTAIVLAAALGGLGSLPKAHATADEFFTVKTPTEVVTGKPSPVVVEYHDPDADNLPYTGTVHFTATNTGGGSITLPADYSFSGGNNYSANVEVFQDGVQFANNGTVTVTATDTVNSALTGTSASYSSKASPDYPSYNNSNTAVGSSTTPSVTDSGGIAVGDLEIVTISSNGGTIGMPAGWTAINTSHANLDAFYQVSTSAVSPGSVITANSFSSSQHWTMSFSAYYNVNATNPIPSGSVQYITDNTAKSGIGTAYAVVSSGDKSPMRTVAVLWESNGSASPHDGTATEGGPSDGGDIAGNGPGTCTSSDFNPTSTRSSHAAPGGTTDNLLTIMEIKSICAVGGYSAPRDGWTWPNNTGSNPSTDTLVFNIQGA